MRVSRFRVEERDGELLPNLYTTEGADEGEVIVEVRNADGGVLLRMDLWSLVLAFFCCGYQHPLIGTGRDLKVYLNGKEVKCLTR